jgi:SET and MYND domain-containing protein 4
MFCRQSCVESSRKSFHQYECGAIDEMLHSLLSSTMQMALRTFFDALSLFDGSVANLENFMKENQKSLTIFDVDYNDRKQKLLVVNSLVFSEDIHVEDSIFEGIFHGSQNLKALWSTHSAFIKSFLKKQTQVAALNYHKIYTWPLKKDGLFDADVDKFKGKLAYKRGVVPFGNGSFPFCSLVNHSCAPNAAKVFENGKFVLVVQRPIDKGEQIFDNYGFSFTNVPREDRRDELLIQYKFLCKCEACEKNWPILPKLKVSDKALLNKAKKACRDLGLSDLNHKNSRSKYEELCELLEKHRNCFPSIEICSLMESASAYFEMTTKPLIQFQ